MTPEDLKADAQAVIDAGGEHMTLILPAGWRRPSDFPRGELLSVNAWGDRNVSVRAQRVLDWLVTRKLA